MKTFLSIFLISCSLCFAAPKSVVILPEKFQNSTVIIENSAQYKNLLLKNTDLAAQLQKQELDWKSYSEKVAEQQKYDAAVQSKLLNDYNSGQLTIQRQSATINKQETKLILWRLYFFGLLTLIIAYFVFKGWLKSTFPILSFL